MNSNPAQNLMALAVAGVLAFTTARVCAHDSSSCVTVTQEKFCRAESDCTFANIAKQAGGVSKFFHCRNFVPLDNQAVVQMNKDTLHSGAVVDTSKGATITMPEIPAGRYASILLIDNDHYCPGVIYEPGPHKLPDDTKYLFLAIRIQSVSPEDPADIELINKLQDQ